MSASNVSAIVIEDDNMIRHVIGAIIVSLGGEIIGDAESGDKGVALFSELEPDLVILDIGLGSESGIDVLKAILKKDSDAYIVMLTANDDPVVAEQCIHAGAKDFINKTLGAHKIADRLKVAVEAVG